MMQGEHKTAEYRAIAPNSRVPALQLDDGTVIMESTAICRYLESFTLNQTYLVKVQWRLLQLRCGKQEFIMNL